MLSQFVEAVRKANRLIVGGMFFPDSPGHMLSECDYLLRLVRTHPQIKARSPIVMLAATPMAQAMAEFLRLHGIQVLIEQHAILLMREIQIFYPELILDVGQAHWKLAIGDREKRMRGDMYPTSFGWALRSEEFINQLVRWHQTWNATRGQLPLLESVKRSTFDPEFVDLRSRQKCALLQIKSQLVNGTIRLLTGGFYRSALEFLRDEGYAIILADREPMLEEFKRFDTFDAVASRLTDRRSGKALVFTEQIASAVAFLASGLSTWTTGSCFHINGGKLTAAL